MRRAAIREEHQLGHVVGHLGLELGHVLLHLADVLGIAGQLAGGESDVVERVTLLETPARRERGSHPSKDAHDTTLVPLRVQKSD